MTTFAQQYNFPMRAPRQRRHKLNPDYNQIMVLGERKGQNGWGQEMIDEVLACKVGDRVILCVRHKAKQPNSTYAISVYSDVLPKSLADFEAALGKPAMFGPAY